MNEQERFEAWWYDDSEAPTRLHASYSAEYLEQAEKAAAWDAWQAALAQRTQATVERLKVKPGDDTISDQSYIYEPQRTEQEPTPDMTLHGAMKLSELRGSGTQEEARAIYCAMIERRTEQEPERYVGGKGPCPNCGFPLESTNFDWPKQEPVAWWHGDELSLVRRAHWQPLYARPVLDDDQAGNLSKGGERSCPDADNAPATDAGSRRLSLDDEGLRLLRDCKDYLDRWEARPSLQLAIDVYLKKHGHLEPQE